MYPSGSDKNFKQKSYSLKNYRLYVLLNVKKKAYSYSKFIKFKPIYICLTIINFETIISNYRMI